MENIAEFQQKHEKEMLTVLLSTFFEFILGADNGMEVLKKLSELKDEERVSTLGGFCEGFIDEHYEEYKDFEKEVLAREFDIVCIDLMKIAKEMSEKRVSGLTLKSIKSQGDC